MGLFKIFNSSKVHDKSSVQTLNDIKIISSSCGTEQKNLYILNRKLLYLYQNSLELYDLLLDDTSGITLNTIYGFLLNSKDLSYNDYYQQIEKVIQEYYDEEIKIDLIYERIQYTKAILDAILKMIDQYLEQHENNLSIVSEDSMEYRIIFFELLRDIFYDIEENSSISYYCTDLEESFDQDALFMSLQSIISNTNYTPTETTNNFVKGIAKATGTINYASSFKEELTEKIMKYEKVMTLFK